MPAHTTVPAVSDEAPSSTVTVRVLEEVSDLADASALLDQVWGVHGHGTVVPVGVLRAWAATGNYVAGAFLGDELVGVSAAFFGHEPAAANERVMHSHITGVTSAARGQRVGFALKSHQRRWAIQRAVCRISWTFDPIVRRNARFNFHKLGVTAHRYLVDFYGGLEDDVNAGQSSDRLWVSWELADPIGRLPAAPAPDAQPLLTNIAGRPVPASFDTAARQWLVAIPDDVEELRTHDPAMAAEWRSAVRAALAVAPDLVVAGVTADSRYLLVRNASR